jgi:hypothetical protein
MLGSASTSSRRLISMAEKWAHGLAGELAMRMQPEMEVSALPVAADFLCSLGNLVGPDVTTLANGQYDSARFNVLKVGLTGVAKSITMRPVERVLALADPSWRSRVEYDAYTPEGLLDLISDHYKDTEGELAEREPREKHRLYRLDEFATILNRSKNPESTLLQYMNFAFDGTPMSLGTLAARQRGTSRSTGHYLSFIANVTTETLAKSAPLAAGGFLNRFLLVPVEKRDVDIPSPRVVDLDDLQRRVSRIATYWRDRGQVVVARSAEADAYWEDIYPGLNTTWPGVYGQMLARGRVLVARVSLAYAIADCASEITPEHLTAALSIWDEHRRTVKETFAVVTGSKYADRILAYLLGEGEWSPKEPLNRLCNGKTDICDAALSLLLRYRLVEERDGTTTPKGGRPAKQFRSSPRLGKLENPGGFPPVFQNPAS